MEIRNPDTIELNITHRCDLNCYNCDRLCNLLKIKKEMSLGEFELFVKESLSTGRIWNTINIIGGEPTLHSELFDVLKILKIYHDHHHETRMIFSTNGYNNKKDLFNGLPDWIILNNTNKKDDFPEHIPITVAPIDLDVYSENRNNCIMPNWAGICLGIDGYFLCSASMAINRVFKLNAAITKLRDVNVETLYRQSKIFCRYCGHYLYYCNVLQKSKLTFQPMSLSWKEALNKIKKD